MWDFKMQNEIFYFLDKQGMIFYVASAMLTNGRYPYIYSSAVVKQCAFNRFTNCHTYYLFISGQKLKTYQSSDWKKTRSRCQLDCQEVTLSGDLMLAVYTNRTVR